MITGIANIGRKLSGKIAITRADISKLKQTLLINDKWMMHGEGFMYLPEKLESKADELKKDVRRQVFLL